MTNGQAGEAKGKTGRNGQDLEDNGHDRYGSLSAWY